MIEIVGPLLFVHVAAGSVALLAALVAISLSKGSTRHGQVGRVYFWAMMTVAATAVPVSILRPNLMLFFVALFSSYMAYAGWRFGRNGRYLSPTIIITPLIAVWSRHVLVTKRVRLFRARRKAVGTL